MIEITDLKILQKKWMFGKSLCFCLLCEKLIMLMRRKFLFFYVADQRKLTKIKRKWSFFEVEKHMLKYLNTEGEQTIFN